VQILLVVALLCSSPRPTAAAVRRPERSSPDLAVLVVGVGVVMAVPALRRKVVPEVRAAFRSLREVARSGHKVAELFGGTIATEVVFALTLAAACRAYGIHLGLAQVLLVNVLASSLAGLVPVPGGIGAAEAALAGGPRRARRPRVSGVRSPRRTAPPHYTPPIRGSRSGSGTRATSRVRAGPGHSAEKCPRFPATR
jgi:hypothetical protein